MASQQQPQSLQIVTLTFKPALQPDPTSPPPAFRDACAALAAVPDLAAIYLGRPMERPASWACLLRWASPTALDAFLASPACARWRDALRDLADSCLVVSSRPPSLRGRLDAALDAPCTEVFTAYGAVPDFADARMGPFADAVDKGHLSGYHGSAYGQFDVLSRHGHDHGPDDTDGATVVMILGWDTKDAHMAYKGPGKFIDELIHHVADGRRSVDMYHVNLTRL